MSAKRKNPLKDLDAFLKQEAASLVTPEKVETPAPEQVSAPVVPEKSAETSMAAIIQELKSRIQQQGEGFKAEFYELIQQVLESQQQLSSKDIMLINTLLYLRNQDNWKERIKEYWDKQS